MKWVLLVLTLGMIVLHQDLWNWAAAEPRAFGFLPIGLWYHALYCVAASILLWLFVAFLWPKHLEGMESEGDQHPESSGH